MAVERKINKGNYIIAALLTIMVFVLGLSLGFLFDNMRLNYSETINKESEVNYLSLQFQYLYLTTLQDTNSSCAVLHSAIEKSTKDLSQSLQDFITFKENSKLNKKQYELIGRRYILDNLKYWLLAKKAKEECNLDVVNVLYFYSTNHCQICPNQGVVLTYFKKQFGDSLLIFPIDVDYEEKEPIISILLDQYDVREHPTLIIEDKKHTGLVSNVEFKDLICNSFKDEKDICKKD